MTRGAAFRDRALADLPAIPRDVDGPVFAEPWEAHAFALAVELSARGCFTWSEWATTLAGEITTAQDAGDADLGGTYYHHWLRALERLLDDKRLVHEPEIASRAVEWRDAYHATPHGKPVVLGRRPGGLTGGRNS